ncbi:hypothetical protein [Bradyrhizobium iriomotense]|nr:hypothetical protein [Bradyrhizobium iriomotense]
MQPLSHSYGVTAHDPREFLEEAAMAAITFSDAGPSGPQRRIWRPDTAMAAQPTNFQPLDPDIVSASIPAFFIGRNKAGFWVVREAKGRAGGLFLFKSSAVHFAHVQSAPTQCALIFPSGSFELDVENRGSPLITRLGRWLDLARRHFGRLATK